MRIACWSWGGRHHVGTVSPCGREATPLAVADVDRGALAIIESLARGEKSIEIGVGLNAGEALVGHIGAT